MAVVEKRKGRKGRESRKKRKSVQEKTNVALSFIRHVLAPKCEWRREGEEGKAKKGKGRVMNKGFKLRGKGTLRMEAAKIPLSKSVAPALRREREKCLWTGTHKRILSD